MPCHFPVFVLCDAGVYAASVIATIHVPIEFSEHVLDDDYFCVCFFIPRERRIIWVLVKRNGSCD